MIFWFAWQVTWNAPQLKGTKNVSEFQAPPLELSSSLRLDQASVVAVMHVFYSFFALLFAAVGVNAHFHLQFPPPRGPFVMNLEPTFCGT